MSYADYITYRNRATTLSGVLAFGGSGVSVGSADPQRVLSGFVSANYFDVLGLRPVVGRTFRADEDDDTGGQPVAVLSHAFWAKQFAADPRVVNTVVPINGQPFTIIGVAPAGFTGVAYANDAEHLWLPLAMHGTVMRTGAASPAASTSRWLRVVGRLRRRHRRPGGRGAARHRPAGGPRRDGVRSREGHACRARARRPQSVGAA